MTLPSLPVGTLLIRYGRSLAVAVGLLLAAVALALAIPVGSGDGGATAEPARAAQRSAAESAPEDLRAFLDSRRWGVSLREVRQAAGQTSAEDAAAVENAAAIDAVTSADYVGFVAAEDRQSALLVLADGKVVRATLGEPLGDGRTLAAVTDDAVTLRNVAGEDEVLALFPQAGAADDGGAG